MKGAYVIAALDRAFGFSGALSRPVLNYGYVGVDIVISRLDSIEECVYNIYR